LHVPAVDGAEKIGLADQIIAIDDNVDRHIKLLRDFMVRFF